MTNFDKIHKIIEESSGIDEERFLVYPLEGDIIISGNIDIRIIQGSIIISINDYEPLENEEVYNEELVDHIIYSGSINLILPYFEQVWKDIQDKYLRKKKTYN